MSRNVEVFAGVDSTGSTTFWVTNGTSGGTYELGYPTFSGGLSIRGAPSVVGAQVFFTSSDTVGVTTNGTLPGTRISVSSPLHTFHSSDFTPFGSGYLFALDTTTESDLIFYDGTVSHTLVSTIFNSGFLRANNITVFGSKAVFVGDDSGGHPNLWVTDGTAAGTTMLTVSGAYANGVVNVTNPDFTRLGSLMLFAGRDSAGNVNLWTTDGTGPGTIELTVAGASASGLNPSGLTVVTTDNFVLFAGTDAAGHVNLWKSDGVSTVELAPLNAFANGLDPQDITAFGSHALFNGIDALGRRSLWVTAGSTQGASLGTEVVSGGVGLDPQDITVFGASAYFNGLDASGHRNLYVVADTNIGAHVITGAGASANGLNPQDISIFGSLLMFNGTDANGQQGLWISDGTFAGTREISVIGASPNGLAPSFLMPLTISTTALNDFSGDGLADVLWRNNDGSLAEWGMSGWQIGPGQPLTYQGNVVKPDASWSIASDSDFNGDGNADILWRQPSTGALVEWTMNGAQIQASQSVTSQGVAVAPDGSWLLLGAGDFNGDGAADMLWRQGAGAIYDWNMNGSQVTSSQAVTSQGNVIAPDASWTVAGVGDFDGDGKTDLLWRQAGTGALVEWFMNGAQVASSSNIVGSGGQPRPDSSWTIAGLGDFDGDGKTDILWRQASTGSVVEWTMVGPLIGGAGNGTNLTYQGNVVSPDASWSVVEVADFNGDGRTDILWRQSTTGSLSEWIMGASQILASQSVTSQSNPVAPDGSWHPQAFPTNAG